MQTAAYPPKTPEGWTARPLFALARNVECPNVGLRESRVLSLSYGRIIERDVEKNFGLLPESFETYNVVEPRDIVLRLTDLQNDKRSLRTGQVPIRGVITSAYTTLRFNHFLDPTFAAYYLHSLDTQKVFYGMGGGVRQSMKFSDIKRITVLVPPRPDQERIVTFLDRETERIDRLVKKKRRLLELLEEKRMALISHAVTKGLDPTVPMQDSGVSWLGEIPREWKSVRVRHLVNRITSGARGWAQHYSDKGDVFLRSANTKRGRIELDVNELARVNVERSVETMRTAVKLNDVVVAITGANVGCVAIVDRSEIMPSYVSQHLALLTVRSGVSPRWVAYGLLGAGAQAQFNAFQYGGTKTQLGLEDVLEVSLALPPLPEQRENAQKLDRSLARLDQANEKLRAQLNKLAEYRQALITAAVTGQLDITAAPKDPEEVVA